MKVIDTCSTTTTHSANLVFAEWANPTGWPAWDSEVKAVHFAGPAKLGARGKMRPASGPSATFSITVYEENRVFTNASTLPGAKLVFEHVVEPTSDGAEIRVSVGVDGLLASLWYRLLRGSMGTPAQSSVSGLINHLDAA